MNLRRKLGLLLLALQALLHRCHSANFKPYFDMPSVVILIKEDVKIGEVVGVLKGEDTEGDPMTFSLGSNCENIFNVQPLNADKVSANLTLKKELNRELTASYTCKAFVSDNPGDSSRQSEELLYVTVVDVNDNKPVFTTQPYRVSVPENATLNTLLLTVHATDADDAANAAVKYRFSNESRSDTKLITLWKTDKFTIHNLNGKITLTGSLDYETATSYVVTVVAEDTGVPQQSTKATVVIDVTDISDMPPVFERSVYIVRITENSPKGTSLVTVAARDGDRGVNNPIRYEITQGNTDGSFKIDPSSGLMTVNGSIDAEKIRSYTITIRASEVPDPSSNTTAQVLVEVLDKNDNPPVLSKHDYEFSVQENQAAPVRTIANDITVTDKDVLLEHRSYRFTLVGGDSSKFSIDPSNGVLKFNSTLDYEIQTNFTFSIVVMETSTAEKFSDNATVVVKLINVNDNTPEFQENSYNYTFNEEIPPGQSIAVITATDGDLGTFGVLKYELKGDGAEYFNVDPVTGNITAAKTLDYENKKSYQFRLFARDGGGGFDYKEASVSIDIKLVDINDNSPIFTKNAYSASISENLPAGTSVLSVVATDKDSGEFGKVSYSISNGNIGNAFTINGTGYISTLVPLDRETTPTYTLSVLASDHGSPNRSTTVIVTVNVLDENDNTPIISLGSDIYLNVSEDKGGGTIVLQSIPTTDKDEGKNKELSYSMSSGNEQGSFNLNSETGRIQISPNGLDREAKAQYDLLINVTDKGNPPRFNITTVHITIIDVNDNAPQFVPSPTEDPNRYIVSINEGPNTVNATIIDLNATDKDYGSNAMVRYTIENGDEHKFFELDQTTGVLRAKKELDRESDQMPKDTSGRGRFVLTVVATDQAEPSNLRKSASTRVTVYVVDTNDNTPKFGKDMYEVRTSEATLSGTNIIQVTAEDGDWDKNGKITYNITAGDEQGTFEITPNGNIAIKKALDAEKVAVYNLTITASDHGNPPMTSVAYVIIYVDDVNDNDPAFNQSKYTASVKENVQLATPVVSVYARDADKGANGKITYSITNGNKNNAFTINNVTGQISTSAQLDRETTSSYTLTVQAQDQGTPSSRKDFTEVEITIEDENDNDPEFLESSYTAEILENSPAGSLLKMNTPVKAKDKDIGNNAMLTFSLSGPGSENFVINATTAIITTSNGSSIDREKNASYALQLTVVDGGGRNSTVALTITIKDVNDESPRFMTKIFYANVSEAARPGTIVRRVTATDDDYEDLNKQIAYSSTGADAKFYINRDTGDIIVDSKIDREVKSQYVLNITAGNYKIKSIRQVPDAHAQVIITVTDVIDDKPFFKTSSITAQLLENATIGTLVTKVEALDKDIDDHLSYEILSGDKYGQFSINNITGEIRTANTLDRENTTQYTLTVRATDSVQLSATVPVIINIEDVNDNDPVFLVASLVVDYQEESPKGTSVLTVKATDLDAGANADVRYSIAQNITEYLSINPVTGAIIQEGKPLDREQSPFFNFTVKATDQGVPPRFALAEVSITLVDINDNDPTFSNLTFYATVKENQPAGTPVIVITATDKDSGDNAELVYGLVDQKSRFSEDFKIDEITGNVTTGEVLNRERISEYTLTIEVSDKAVRPRKGSAELKVQVLDDNDHAPVFTETTYTDEVNENVGIGSSVTKVEAKDSDMPMHDNTRISYEIVSGNQKPPNWFYSYDLYWPFNSISHKTTTGSTPGVIRGDINLVQGPGMNAMSLNGINSDINLGDLKKTCVTDPELCPEGMSLIFWLKLDSLANSYTSFSREGFVLSSGGELPLSKGVAVYLNDRKLHVKVSTSTAQWHCNASFVIDRWSLVTITWANKTGLNLYFNSSKTATALNGVYTAERRSGSSIRVFIGRSNGIQPKHAGFSISSLAVRYKIIGLEEIRQILVSENAFAINATSGVITTASKLDRETNDSYSIVIMAKDHGTPSLESNTTVKITVTDFNDNAPNFTKSLYSATLKENANKGTIVATVSATDADIGVNSKIKYKIESGDADPNIFTIDNEAKGVITLEGKLDYEDTQVFKLNVSAKDGGTIQLTGYTLVEVKIIDVDDNAPKFTPTKYQASVLENITQWTSVIQLNATDPDSAQAQGNITFRIENGNVGNMFAIGRLNGTVYLLCGDGKCLDREEKAQYTLTVAAISMVNTTEQKGTTQLIIQILDVNDEEPVFVNAPYVKTIPEDIGDEIIGVNENILTLSATDKDIGPNAEIIYTIVSGNDEGYFALNNITGKLSKVKLLDREKTASFHFVVKATDKGVPSLSSTTNVTLKIKDQNDNHPNFTSVGMEVYRVLENITVGTQITQFNATDKDEGNNAIIKFVILSGNSDGAFVLDEAKGTLKTAKGLDHETTADYNLIVQARDSGNPALTAQKAVKIIVTDLNDNSPKFPSNAVTLSVPENLPPGAVVGTVIARDFDETDKVFYYFVEGINTFFALDETTGNITTKKMLDREVQATYILDITASNYKLDPNTLKPRARRRRAVSDSPSVTSSIQRVTITIGDKNDNGPKFKNRLYTGGVSDSIKHGAKALLVTATDADSGNNSRIAYSIDNSRFSVEKDTGWILAASSFAGETGKEYTFTITAKDNFGAEPYFNDTTKVTIYILVDKQRAVLISGRQPEEVRLHKDDFKRILENITGYIINIDDINYYQDETGEYDKSRTGVLFHAVDPSTNRIVDRDTLIRNIDENYTKQKKFFTDWQIKGVKEYIAPEKKSTFDLKLVLAIGFGVLLVFLLCIFCCIVALLRKRQKRRLRAAQAQSYGASSHVSRRSSMSTLPNTNLHNHEGSNPIWVDPYHNWGMDNDDDESDFRTFKANGSLSNGGPHHSDYKVKSNTANPLFESRETYLNLDFDNNETADIDLSTIGGHSSFSDRGSNRTPSPEPYESSPQSERNFYDNAEDKYKVTSI